MIPINIEGWPFPVMGPLTPKTQVLVGGVPDTKKLVETIMLTQEQKLKKFDDSLASIFQNNPYKRVKKK